VTVVLRDVSSWRCLTDAGAAPLDAWVDAPQRSEERPPAPWGPSPTLVRHDLGRVLAHVGAAQVRAGQAHCERVALMAAAAARLRL